jgi:hypothetical protein
LSTHPSTGAAAKTQTHRRSWGRAGGLAHRVGVEGLLAHERAQPRVFAPAPGLGEAAPRRGHHRYRHGPPIVGCHPGAAGWPRCLDVDACVCAAALVRSSSCCSAAVVVAVSRWGGGLHFVDDGRCCRLSITWGQQGLPHCESAHAPARPRQPRCSSGRAGEQQPDKATHTGASAPPPRPAPGAAS